MYAVRRSVLTLTLLSLALVLSGCGSSSSGGSHPIATAPIFTSVPVTAAAQGTAYSYTVAATDPSGGTVSFALTTAPTGASLNSNAISWTPAASQSRTSNSFTVTATTSEGGTANQTWTVSPTGIITVNEVLTYWGPSGQQQVPAASAVSNAIAAVVPQADGSLLVLKGSTISPGVVNIPGVPAGNYWLTFGTVSLLPPLGAASYWTNTSTFDAGRNFIGSQAATLSSNTDTQFDFNLSGLTSVNAATPVLFNAETQSLSPEFQDPPNSSTLSTSIGMTSNIDWTKATTGFLTQYEPSSLGPLSNLVLGASAVTPLSLSNGVTNTITQTLQPSTGASLNVTVPGSQWAPMLQTGVSPNTATSYASGFSLAAQPFVTGVNAHAQLSAAELVLAGTAPQFSGFGFTIYPFGGCDGPGFALVSVGPPIFDTQPAIFTDQNLGALSYSDPFDSTWTRTESFCQEAVVPIAVPNSSATVNFFLVDSETIAPTGSALAPIVGPVQNPTIGGGSLFTATTLNTATPGLTWSAPATGTPYGYRVTSYVLDSFNGVNTYALAGSFYTSQTSVTLPPLSGGNTYVFAIAALVDGTANLQTAPYRSTLPVGYAHVVSAPITISSGAATPQIRGDARVIRNLSKPR